MAEFNPEALLRQMRDRTPTKNTPPPPPPRPPHETDVNQRLSQLEEVVMQLQKQLTETKQSEKKVRKENKKLNEAIQQLRSEQSISENRHKDQIRDLEQRLTKERKQKRQLEQMVGDQQETRPRTPPLQTSTPTRKSPTPTVQPRQPQRGKLDLSPLKELYKAAPDFPRPVLHIDFSAYM